jgi:hypothetical protein
MTTKADRAGRERPLTKGLSSSPEYRAWVGMWNRCSGICDPVTASHYQGRGIKVCDRWRTLESFISDLGPRPSSSHSVDRVDVDGDYEPGNVRWALKSEQSKNRRPSSEWKPRPPPTSPPSKNAEKLRRYLFDHRTTGAAFARRVGVNAGMLGQYISGHRRPGLTPAFLIHEATGGVVDVHDWLTGEAAL